MGKPEDLKINVGDEIPVSDQVQAEVKQGQKFIEGMLDELTSKLGAEIARQWHPMEPEHPKPGKTIWRDGWWLRLTFKDTQQYVAFDETFLTDLPAMPEWHNNLRQRLQQAIMALGTRSKA